MQGAIKKENIDKTKTVDDPQNLPSQNDDDKPASTDMWEHKYKTLQGKYNTEIGRLQVSLRNLQAENEALKTELNTLKEMVQKKIEPQQDPLESIKDTLPELYDALKQATSNYVTRNEIKNLKQELSKEIKPFIASTVESQLSAFVPDWLSLNDDPDFLAWLQQKARYSTKTLHELMLEAYEAGDAKTVAQFFIDYKKQKAPKPSQNVAPVGRQVSTPNTPSKPVIRREEITKFYRDCALGRYTPEQKARKEAEIKQAILEGRVVD